MFGRVKSLPCMYSYAHAKGIYERTNPIRGTDIVPLGDRRHHDRYRLEMRGDVIHCIYHRTAVLKIYPDDTFAIDPSGWHTMTTAQVLNMLIPVGSVYTRMGVITYGLDGGEHRCDAYGGLIVKRNPETGRFYVANPQACVIHKVNRKKANAVRKRYAAFLTYAKGWRKLRGDAEGYMTLSMDELEAAGITGRPHALTLERWIESDDPEDHYHAVLGFAYKSVSYRWGGPVCVHATQIDREINNFLLKINSDEVLERVELPIGVIKKDNYAHLV